MIFYKLNKYHNFGLLLLRVGIGIMFMIHGYPKLIGGPEVWAKIGGVLSTLGIGFAPTLMGFMAAISEFIGGLLLILGLFTRPACFFLFSTMVVATSMHINNGDSFGRYSHALEAVILFLSFIFIGPGEISLDEKFSKKRSQKQ